MSNLCLTLFLFAVLPYSLWSAWYVNTPITILRVQPNQESEVISQAYYSEEVHPLEKSGKWTKIATAVDGYQGWVQSNTLIQRAPLTGEIAKVSRCAAHLYRDQDTVYGPLMTLPFDSRLEILENDPASNSRWVKVALTDGKEGFIQRGDLSFDHSPLTMEQMCSLSYKFLGLPYTWGGRSSFGYDCSGFAQMLYRQMGIYLPRDARDQIGWEGFKEISLDKLEPGDLIFFGFSEDKIQHAVISLGERKFIHATVRQNRPYIHIDDLADAEWNGTQGWTYRAARRLNK